MLTSDMRAVIKAAHLCFVATVTADGRPSLSPKGTIRVWDDTRLYFLDLASPGTRANLAHSSWVEINVVEELSRRGYRFAGPATLHLPGSPIFEEGVKRIYAVEPPTVGPAAVVLIDVERAEALISPAYWRGLDERAMRRIWRERRAELDLEFERYLAGVEPLRVDRGPSDR